MSAPRLGRSRNIRVGSTSGVGVRVLPTAHYGGRLGRSRDIRVWGAGGGGTPVNLDNWLYGTWGYIAGVMPIRNDGAPTLPLSATASLVSSVGLGYFTSVPGYASQSAGCIYIQADVSGVTARIAYRVSASEANGWGGVVPWELRATPWYTASATVTDDGFDGTSLVTGSVDTTGHVGAVTVTGNLTVTVPASGQVTLGVAVPGFDSVVFAALGAHPSIYELVTLGIDSISIL